MNREIVNSATKSGPIVSSINGAVLSRSQRVHGRLGLESLAGSLGSEESLVIDDRCDVSPAQLVETKLSRVLGGGMLPVSHLQTRGLLRQR